MKDDKKAPEADILKTITDKPEYKELMDQIPENNQKEVLEEISKLAAQYQGIYDFLAKSFEDPEVRKKLMIEMQKKQRVD